MVVWRMYKELFNGAWCISGSWWAHLCGLVRFHITGNPEDDPLVQYMVNNPEKYAEMIHQMLDELT